MAIPQSFLDELKQRCDIESLISSYLPLKRQGRTCKGLCPFHSEKTPSMVVYPENQSFYCFGCGAGGDVINFVMRIENLGYLEALRFLAQRAGLAFPEEDREDPALRMRPIIYEINRLTARYYHDCLKSEAGAPGRAYFSERGLLNRTLVHYGLGYAPEGWHNLRDYLHKKGFTDEQMLAAAVVGRGRNGGCYDLFRNRVIFPIIDLRKNVIGFGGRVLDDSKPKYLNSSDTLVFKKSRNLFSLNFAKNAGTDQLILAEGYMDVIAVHQAGFENVVATLGTALTSEQCRLISGYAKEVIIAYDSDGAGRAATSRAMGLLEEVGVKTRILSMQGAKDPDEYLKKFGAQRFKLLLEGAGNVIEYQLNQIRSKYDLEEPDQRASFLTEAVKYLATVPNPLEREIYGGILAKDTGVQRETILENISQHRRKKARQAEKKTWSDIQAGRSSLPAAPGMPVRRGPSAKAEDGIFACLMRHPDLAERVSALSLEDFQTEEGKRLFTAILEQMEAQGPLDLTSLSPRLQQAEVNLLARIQATHHELVLGPETMDSYIRALKDCRRKAESRQAAGSDEDAAAMAEAIRRRKK